MIQDFLNEVEGEVARIAANYLLKEKMAMNEHFADFLSGWSYLKADIIAKTHETGQGDVSTGPGDTNAENETEAVTGDSVASDGKSEMLNEMKPIPGTFQLGTKPLRLGKAKSPEGVLPYGTQEGSEPAIESVVPSMPSEPATAINAFRTKCPFCEKDNFDGGQPISIREITKAKPEPEYERKSFALFPHDFLTCFSCGGIYAVEDRTGEIKNKAEVFASVESLQFAFVDLFWHFLTEPFIASNVKKDSSTYEAKVRNLCERILEAYRGRAELNLK